MQPILDRWLYLQDTCGVHNLHGLPGVFSGLASALAASAAEEMGGRNKAAYGNRWNMFEDHTMLLIKTMSGIETIVFISTCEVGMILCVQLDLCTVFPALSACRQQTLLTERWTMSTCWWLLFKTLVWSYMSSNWVQGQSQLLYTGMAISDCAKRGKYFSYMTFTYQEALL